MPCINNQASASSLLPLRNKRSRVSVLETETYSGGSRGFPPAECPQCNLCFAVVAVPCSCSSHFYLELKSCSCHNKFLQTEWLKTTATYFVTVMETRGPQSRCQQGPTPSERSRENLSLPKG